MGAFMAFEIFGAVLLILVGVLIGYGIFVKRSDPLHLEMDQDFVDCQDQASNSGDLVACYVDKKTRKVKDYLKATDATQ